MLLEPCNPSEKPPISNTDDKDDRMNPRRISFKISSSLDLKSAIGEVTTSPEDRHL